MIVSQRSSFRSVRYVGMTSITYTYPGVTEPVLKDISLAIQRGEFVGFIGASGAGKSTLVDILLGLLTPERGEVRVDGKNIQANLRNWQDQIGYVPQSIFLTDDTLRRNVAFGLPDKQIDNAAVSAPSGPHNLRSLWRAYPMVWRPSSASVAYGSREDSASALVLPASIYHDPAVLVLDEATSSLDTETERGVMQAITALQGSKTIFIIAHRLSTVEHCNRLYRLEQGHITGQGNYEVMTRVSQVRA